MSLLEERRKKVWSEYSLVNQEYFNFILQFIEHFNERWCENFYNLISSNSHTSSYKFIKFTKKLNHILKSKNT
jgi:hypothetical protein